MATYMTESAPNEDNSKITRLMLKKHSGEFDLEVIHTLNLNNLGVENLGCLSECAGLERLDLSQNGISRLLGLAGLTNLVLLNLSCNHISSLEGLQTLDNLEQLNLAGNLITSAGALRSLSCLESFTSLCLNERSKELSNPLCHNLYYRDDVLHILPKLQVLDGEVLVGNGSEFFKTCNNMDVAIKKLTDQSTSALEIGKWPDPDFYTHKNESQFDTSDKGDVENQLDILLSDCKRLSDTADDVINQLQNQVQMKN